MQTSFRRKNLFLSKRSVLPFCSMENPGFKSTIVRTGLVTASITAICGGVALFSRTQANTFPALSDEKEERYSPTSAL